MLKIKLLVAFGLFGLNACSSAPQRAWSLAAAVATATQHAGSPYQSALVDLNGDGQDDAVVLLSGNDWCGTGGCTLLVFKNDRNGYLLISRSTVTRSPIRVYPVATNGWKGLMVSTRGVADALMVFDGSTYPDNPSMQPAANAAQIAAATTIIE